MFDLTTIPSQRHAEAEDTRDSTSLWDVLSGSYQAWSAERTADARVRIITAQTRILEAQSRFQLAEQICRRDELLLEQQIEQESRELSFWKQLRSVSEADRLSFLEREQATQILLNERERIRQARFSGPEPIRPAALPVAEEPPVNALTGPVMQPYLQDDAIEKIATKAVMKLGHLTGSAAEQGWSAFKQELYRRFPQNIAAEIDGRVNELRQVGDIDDY